MTLTEENNYRLEYATEDVNYAAENGRLAICETNKGLIEIEALGKKYFQVWNNKGELLTGIMPKYNMIKYIAKVYVFETK